MKQDSKPKVIFFQGYLRNHVLNFARFVQGFDFSYPTPKKARSFVGPRLTFESMVNNKKASFQRTIQRLLGLPNIRIILTKTADLLFSYSGLVISNNPHIIYIETGFSFFNYDPVTANHPLARWLVIKLTTQERCRQLVFMSEAAKKSFYATVPMSRRAREKLEEKSIVIYPITNQTVAKPKTLKGNLKLLYIGNYYIKGGVELVNAFKCLKKRHRNLELTIVTPVLSLRASDKRQIERLDGIQLIDAKLSEEEIARLYAKHHLFVLPTYRESFGLVIVEAMAAGLPVICTDQFATTELVRDGYNGFVFPNHPLKDYDPKTYKMFGRLQRPTDFFELLFAKQKKGGLRPIERFIEQSIECFLDDPPLFTKFSKNALTLYEEKFSSDKLIPKMEKVLRRALK